MVADARSVLASHSRLLVYDHLPVADARSTIIVNVARSRRGQTNTSDEPSIARETAMVRRLAMDNLYRGPRESYRSGSRTSELLMKVKECVMRLKPRFS